MDIRPLQKKKPRVPEIDFLRGAALLLMIFHHTIYDVRYVFNVDAFAFQDDYWFYRMGRPLILALFLVVSGISTSFSRSHLNRGIRMLVFAVLATILTTVAHLCVNWIGVIFFNVIHVIAVSTLVYAGIDYCLAGRRGLAGDQAGADGDGPGGGVSQLKKRKETLTGWLIAAGTLAVSLGPIIAPILPEETYHPLLVVLGAPVAGVEILDQLPLFPFLGYYLLGAAIGHTLYESGEPLWKREGGVLNRLGQPVRFLGRHALLVYLLHQPICLGVLWLLSKAGVF